MNIQSFIVLFLMLLWPLLVLQIYLLLLVKAFLVYLLCVLPSLLVVHQVRIERPPVQIYQLRVLVRYLLLLLQYLVD